MVLTDKLHSAAIREHRAGDKELSDWLLTTFAELIEEKPTLDAPLDDIIDAATRLGAPDRVLLYIRDLYDLEGE